MKLKAISIVFIALILTGVGCSHTSKKVDQKIAAEPTIKNSEELNAEASALIVGNPSFTPEQKNKLLALQKKNIETLKGLREQGLKIRALLIQEVTNTNYNEKEVKVIESKLRKNENEKLKTYFYAIEDVNKILGRESEQEKRQELMRDLIDIHERN